MNTLERLKRRVVSRLTDEVDITYIDSQVDNKVAFLRYKDRELLVVKTGENDFYIFYTKLRDEYEWIKEWVGYTSKELVIAQAEQVIKDRRR